MAATAEEPLTWDRTLTEAFAVVGLLPDVFWGLTWNDYYDIVFHYHYQEQKNLRGHREVATRIYNVVGSFSQGFRPIAATDYWPLPLIDPAPTKAELPPAEWWAKMEALAARSGKRFAPIKD